MQFCHQPFLVLTNYNISTSLFFFYFLDRHLTFGDFFFLGLVTESLQRDSKVEIHLSVPENLDSHC